MEHSFYIDSIVDGSTYVNERVNASFDLHLSSHVSMSTTQYHLQRINKQFYYGDPCCALIDIRKTITTKQQQNSMKLDTVSTSNFVQWYVYSFMMVEYKTINKQLQIRYNRMWQYNFQFIESQLCYSILKAQNNKSNHVLRCYLSPHAKIITFAMIARERWMN